MESANTSELKSRIQYLEDLLKKNNIPFESATPLTPAKTTAENDSIEKTSIRKLHDDAKVLLARYGRQIILPEISFEGQKKIIKTKVLIIGAGGIGAPAAFYLAGAGVGTLGIVDGDTVDESNLHRQIIHNRETLKLKKVVSAKMALQKFNDAVEYVTYDEHLSPANAEKIIEGYDIVLDASDNASARYLVNDACMKLKVDFYDEEKPLISGSALRWEGQLTVFGYNGGPCYRCLFPECPPPSVMTNCGEGGVVGMIPGIIGQLEAVECLKIILGMDGVLNQRMLIYDGKSAVFKTIKIRGRKIDCLACGDSLSIDIKAYNYPKFVGLDQTCSTSTPTDIDPSLNINWKDFVEIMNSPDFTKETAFVDVRPQTHYSISHVGDAVNIPVDELELMDDAVMLNRVGDQSKKVYVMCRRGISSKKAVRILLERGYKNVFNIVGGINQYAKDVDPNIPLIQ